MEKILVGKDIAVGSATNPSNVPDGAIAIFNGDTNALLSPGDTITDASSIYLVQGVASTDFPVISQPIQGTGMRVWKGTSYTAPVKQVTNIGYVGSGSLDINTVNSGVYTLGVTDLRVQAEPYLRKSVSIVADSAATSFEIADALCKQINSPKNRGNLYVSDPNNFPVIAEALSSQASTILGGSETLTVTYRSKIVTSSGTSHGLVSGDFVRIGSATATTSPVYKVESVSGATINLTREYAGASATGVAAGELDAVPDTSDDAGIKLTAIDFGTFFTVYLDEDFEDTPITYTTPYTPGSGTYDAVLAYERKNRGFWGNLNNTILPVTQTYYAVSGATYDLYTILVSNTITDRSFPTNTAHVTGQITIAIPAGAASQAAFEATMNPWMASTPAALPSVNL